MKKAFSGFNNIQIASVSPWVYTRSIQSPILEGLSQSVVLNGVNTEVFKIIEKSSLKTMLCIPEKTKVVLQVTSNFSADESDIKGGKYLIELAKSMQDKDVVFVVVGKNNVTEELPDNLKLVGVVKDQSKLAEYYNMADLCVVTSKRETFGMTVAESLCCGTPIVGFKSGGSESIAIKEYTEFFDFADVKSLKTAITNKWLNYKTEKNRNEIESKAKEVYDSKIMAEKYCNIYEVVLRSK